MKRDSAVEPLAEAHLPYLWAAYRRGLFGDEFDDDMAREDFITNIADKLDLMERSGGRIDMLIGPTDTGMIPVGVVVSARFVERLWPHVVWFPEAGARNKLELVVRFFAERCDDMVVLGRPQVGHFFDHVCKYGVLRPVGKFRGLYDGVDATIYETV